MAGKMAKIVFQNALYKQLREVLKDSVNIMETESEVSFFVEPGQSIHQAFLSLSIKLPQPAVALVNGKTKDFAYVLQSEDEAIILFQISGG